MCREAVLCKHYECCEGVLQGSQGHSHAFPKVKLPSLVYYSMHLIIAALYHFSGKDSRQFCCSLPWAPILGIGAAEGPAPQGRS